MNRESAPLGRAGRLVAMACGAAAFFAGCPGPEPPPVPDGSAMPDGGSEAGADAMPPGTALLVVEIEAEDLLPGDSLQIGVASLRASNDRGPDFEPVFTDIGALVLVLDGDQRIDFDAVSPATYGRAVMELDSGPWGPTFEWRHGESPRIVIRGEVPLLVDVRCDRPLSLAPGMRGDLDLFLDAGDLEQVLETQTLPDPVAGEVVITAGTAPQVLSAIETAFLEAWRMGCL